ncbi:hypothetical protein CIRG_04072 [Coccidioides immitis RMSCC 2394]|uniref:Uncharacterized protein n=1 Tax=Coccidioides immitis RMSCC 2394 TaxID=404692 RepID=A0A0J6Y6T0_COCIT|nr:hypothetical protein CIRG_04072 [Coccidioides immitis RMSCC 2394]
MTGNDSPVDTQLFVDPNIRKIVRTDALWVSLRDSCTISSFWRLLAGGDLRGRRCQGRTNSFILHFFPLFTSKRTFRWGRGQACVQGWLSQSVHAFTCQATEQRLTRTVGGEN